MNSYENACDQLLILLASHSKAKVASILPKARAIVLQAEAEATIEAYNTQQPRITKTAVAEAIARAELAKEDAKS